MAGYRWLTVITGWLWVIPVFSNNNLQNQTEPPEKAEQFDKPANTDLTIGNELESEPLVRFQPR